jgi:hypothetical protein
MYEWNGEAGALSYYDKEQGKNIDVLFSKDKPFEMLVLDQLNGVGGWSDQHNTGIWSTEVRSSKDDITVFAGKRPIYTGKYKDEQGINQVAGFGGRYAKIVYFAHREGEDWHISRIRLVGVAVTAWIDFTNDIGRAKIDNGKVLLTGSTEGKKGKVVYQKPEFTCVPATKEENDQAILLDKALQQYLTSYLTAPQYDDTDTSVHEESETGFLDSFNTAEGGKASPEAVAQFERLKAGKLGASTGKTQNDSEPDQEAYNRAAVAAAFGDGEPMPEPPEEYR